MLWPKNRLADTLPVPGNLVSQPESRRQIFSGIISHRGSHFSKIKKKFITLSGQNLFVFSDFSGIKSEISQWFVDPCLEIIMPHETLNRLLEFIGMEVDNHYVERTEFVFPVPHIAL